MDSPASILPHPWPADYPRSTDYSLTINDISVDVLRCQAADFAAFTLPTEAAAVLQVHLLGASAGREAVIRPLRHGIQINCSEPDRISFLLHEPARLFVDIGRRDRPLYLFAVAPEQAAPDPADPRVHYFKGGEIHEVGELNLGSGETLYLEPGAILRGWIRARGADGIRLAGQGVIDGTPLRGIPGTRGRLLYFEDCQDLRINGLYLANPVAWQCHLNRCDQAVIEDLVVMGRGNGTDGIDIVSSSEVRVRHCFLSTGDDCVAVKAADWDEDGGALPGRDVRDILVEGCVLLNDGGGSNLEVGHELRTASVRDIVFRDCDLLHKHGHGSAFSIANAAYATVENVTFEKMRVEHYYESLFSVRVLATRFSGTDRRGQVRGVRLRDIRVHHAPVNLGYSIGLIGGCNALHTVDDVSFESVFLNDRPILGLEDFDTFTRFCQNIRFSA